MVNYKIDYCNKFNNDVKAQEVAQKPWKGQDTPNVILRLETVI